ncbi:MAG: efflux RND transporter periplasmic adaptor subunit [Chitinophagaceae bacterium]
MKQILGFTLAATLVLMMASCGNSSKDERGSLGDKKVELEKKKKQKNDLDGDIRKLEEEIAKADPNSTSVKKLVSVAPVTVQDFIHYIELQGKVDAKNIAYVSPRGMGGQVKGVFVTEGQVVRKGQLLLKLDDVLARQSVAAAEQGVAGLESQARLTQSVFERQQNLWKQNIGTEVQVLQAKTAAEAATAQLNAARVNVRQANEQVNQTNIYAEISGTIDRLNIRVGEMFSGVGGDGKPQVTIVNTSDLKAYVQVPENYLAKIKVGAPVQVVLPELNNRVIPSKISVASKLIDPTNRSFYAEAKLPADKDLRPNQSAVVKIEDYKSTNALTVPINVVQSDEKGKFLYIAETNGGKTVARRRIVIPGESYGGQMEIKSGLKEGEQIITEGYQTVYDGQNISAAK